jgi:hypothetical protein
MNRKLENKVAVVTGGSAGIWLSSPIALNTNRLLLAVVGAKAGRRPPCTYSDAHKECVFDGCVTMQLA